MRDFGLGASKADEKTAAGKNVIKFQGTIYPYTARNESSYFIVSINVFKEVLNWDELTLLDIIANLKEVNPTRKENVLQDMLISANSVLNVDPILPLNNTPTFVQGSQNIKEIILPVEIIDKETGNKRSWVVEG